MKATKTAQGSVLKLVDRSLIPNADGDYTPAQRMLIDIRLAKADRDIQEGRLHGPFDTHAQMISFLHEQVEQSEREYQR